MIQYKDVDPIIKNAIDNLISGYKDLQDYRRDYSLAKLAYQNALIDPFSIDTTTKDPNILRSHFIAIAAEIFMNGMSFPSFKIESKNATSNESKTKESVAQSLLEWVIRVSGFEDVYEASKENWVVYGDAYRRPFAVPLSLRNKRTSGKNTKKAYPQYEDISGYNIIFDPYGVDVYSETVSRMVDFWGYTSIYSEGALKKKFGKKIINFAQDGVMVDVDEYNKHIQKGTKQKFYEVIEYQSDVDEVELVLIGSNAFPVCRYVADDNAVPPKDIEDLVVWENEYKHYDQFGRPKKTLQNVFFYYMSDQVRNKGLAHKLYRSQVADEIIENSKLASTRKKMIEIPVISGGRAEIIEQKIKRWQENASTNLLEVLHIPSNVQNVLPVPSTIRFAGVSAEEGRQTTNDIHSFARNAVGVSLDRSEIQIGLGVGQSEILEDEKTVSIERVVKRCIANLRNEFISLLDYIINMGGFNLDEKIRYKKFVEVEGATKTIVFEHENAEISITEAAKMLLDYEFNLFIDRNTIVEKRQVVMVEKFIKWLGIIDPRAIPNVAKSVMKQIAEIMRIEIPYKDFDGIENSQAQGGLSQFKSINNGQVPKMAQATLSQQIT